MDRLERELEGRAEVVRVDAMTQVGAELARRYGVRAVPTLFVFDGAGQVVYSGVGLPNQEAITAAVSQILGQE